MATKKKKKKNIARKAARAKSTRAVAKKKRSLKRTKPAARKATPPKKDKPSKKSKPVARPKKAAAAPTLQTPKKVTPAERKPVEVVHEAPSLQEETPRVKVPRREPAATLGLDEVAEAKEQLADDDEEDVDEANEEDELLEKAEEDLGEDEFR